MRQFEQDSNSRSEILHVYMVQPPGHEEGGVPWALSRIMHCRDTGSAVHPRASELPDRAVPLRLPGWESCSCESTFFRIISWDPKYECWLKAKIFRVQQGLFKCRYLKSVCVGDILMCTHSGAEQGDKKQVDKPPRSLTTSFSFLCNSLATALWKDLELYGFVFCTCFPLRNCFGFNQKIY